MLATQDNSFALFALEHVAAVAVVVVVAVGLPLWARRSARRSRWGGVALGGLLLVNEAIRLGWDLAHHTELEFLRQALPLHVCGAAVFLTALSLFRPHQRAFEVAWTWGLAGTLQAIVTPNLLVGFPSYDFVQFFVGHGGIVVGVVFAAVALGRRPGPGAVWRVLVITNLFALAVGLADWLLGANYMFLRQPPRGASPLFFLPWPWYIPVMEPVALALAGLVMLPFGRHVLALRRRPIAQEARADAAELVRRPVLRKGR